MALMLVITITALLYKSLYEWLYLKFIMGQWGEAGATTLNVASTGLQIAIAFVLVGLALAIAYMGITNIQQARSGAAVATDGGETADD
jgi:carbon starvation protein